MSLVSKLRAFGEAIGELDITVYHYFHTRPEDVIHYMVWAEDEEADSLDADNIKQEQGIHGTVDLFSLVEYDEMIDTIQEFLNEYENLSFRLNSTQYEDETKLIHTEWEFWLR